MFLGGVGIPELSAARGTNRIVLGWKPKLVVTADWTHVHDELALYLAALLTKIQQITSESMIRWIGNKISANHVVFAEEAKFVGEVIIPDVITARSVRVLSIAFPHPRV